MGRGKKAALCTLSSVLLQAVSMICGFILPRLILVSFGSAYNGITSSVSQFLSVIALLRAGVGGATRATLYRSLANNDNKSVSATIRATEKFMRKVALLFMGLMLVFACFYPYLVEQEFEWLFSSTLVVIISLSTFMQYFFGITYQILLQADQRQYVYSFISIASVILNTLFAIVLISLGVGIHGVKLGSALAYSVTPIGLYIYVRRNYKIDKKAIPDYSSISQRWDAFFHQVASFIHNNTDITLLTLFTNMKQVSVYSVYSLVGNGLRNIVSTIAVGVEAAFGNMLARNETSTLNQNFDLYQMLMHIVCCCLFGAGAILITPFIEVYTLGVNDADYHRISFGYLVMLAHMLACLISPYQAAIQAKGDYKQTKKYAGIEAAINVVVSVVLVIQFGLIGVMIGTIVSMTYRIIMYAKYASRNVVSRPFSKFAKRFLVSIVNIAAIFILESTIPLPVMNGYLNWGIYAICISSGSIIITLSINYIAYRNDLKVLITKVYNTIRNKPIR